jgi:hypothetical protein
MGLKLSMSFALFCELFLQLIALRSELCELASIALEE